MDAMVRLALPVAALALLAPAAPAMADSACALCFGNEEPEKPGERPLIIEITSGMTFSRLALTGTGFATAEIDAMTGEKRTTGPVMDLGGTPVQGRARISGVARRAIRVIMPGRVTMTSSTGATAELSDFATDLAANPVLDAGGNLEFSFGGILTLKGPVGGSLRGRIPISVEYD